MDVQIRGLQPGDDLHDLIALSRSFFAEYEAHHEDFFRIDTLRDEDILGYFSLFLEKDDHAAFIALQAGRTVGYITVYVQDQPVYWQVKRVGHISGLMVGRELRRKGIGAGLLERARAWFRERGVRYHTVYTAVKNRRALGFYASQGMEPLYTHFVGE